MNQIQKVSFAHLPTLIEQLPQLTEYLGGPNIMVKRDDQTGLAFGGNKTRKLEYLIADAQISGAKTIITAGAIQSNHCRQTAAAAAKFGFDCTLVLAGEIPERPTANYLIDKLLGVEVVWADWDTRVDALHQAYERLKSEGESPYLVPYGGSNSTGALGYAYAIQELVSQNCFPDWIVFPSSSGGTQAGMVAGARVFGYSGRILGISVDEPADDLMRKVAGLASEVSERLGASKVFETEEILVNANYCGTGYGNVTGDEVNAIKLFAKEEGLLLDPVYTGRAAAGLVDLIKNGFFSEDETVLFWHTGGTPALFAQKYQGLFDQG